MTSYFGKCPDTLILRPFVAHSTKLIKLKRIYKIFENLTSFSNFSTIKRQKAISPVSALPWQLTKIGDRNKLNPVAEVEEVVFITIMHREVDSHPRHAVKEEWGTVDGANVFSRRKELQQNVGINKKSFFKAVYTFLK